ncbi:hypothetical protein, partial [Streptococcus pneumoniae]
ANPEDPVSGDGGVPPSGEQPPTASLPAPEPPPVRRPIFELTRKYIHPTYRAEFDVEAFSVDPTDPQLPAGQPWA